MSAARSFDAGVILPQTFSSRAATRLVVERENLPGGRHRHIGAGDRALLDGIEQCLRPGGAGGERLHRVELLLGGELRVRLEDRGGVSASGNAASPRIAAAANGRVVEQLVEGLGEVRQLARREQFDRGPAVFGRCAFVSVMRLSSYGDRVLVAEDARASASASRDVVRRVGFSEASRYSSGPVVRRFRRAVAAGERFAQCREDVDAGRIVGVPPVESGRA